MDEILRLGDVYIDYDVTTLTNLEFAMPTPIPIPETDNVFVDFFANYNLQCTVSRTRKTTYKCVLTLSNDTTDPFKITVTISTKSTNVIFHKPDISTLYNDFLEFIKVPKYEFTESIKGLTVLKFRRPHIITMRPFYQFVMDILDHQLINESHEDINLSVIDFIYKYALDQSMEETFLNDMLLGELDRFSYTRSIISIKDLTTGLQLITKTADGNKVSIWLDFNENDGNFIRISMSKTLLFNRHVFLLVLLHVSICNCLSIAQEYEYKGEDYMWSELINQN